jgi:peptidyl-prolyl cis-trans isomerase SurA
MGFRLLLVSMAAACYLRAADISVIDEIICKVNGEIVTRGDYDRSRRNMEASLRQQGAAGTALSDAMKLGERNILRERIDQLLLQSKGKELNINVDTEVNKQMAEMQRASKIADPEKFQEFVREGTGMSYEDYKNDLKTQAMTNRVIRQEVSSKIQIKHEEAQQYYDTHKDEFQRQERVFLREILVNADGDDLAAAEKKAKDLSTRGKKGERFEDLATANSDSPTGPQGGDIGSYERGKLRPELEKLVWDQPKGFVTDPIRLNNGFLLLKVDEHQKAGLAGFDEVQNEVTQKLFSPRFQPELRKYLTDLRLNAFLEIKPGYEDTGAAPGKKTDWVDPAEIKPETVTKEQVAAKQRKKRLLGVVPIPGTAVQNTGTSSSK